MMGGIIFAGMQLLRGVDGGDVGFWQGRFLAGEILYTDAGVYGMP